MLKKTTVSVLGLAASGFAFAGAMGPVCTPGNMTVPCEARQWDFGIQALYLQSNYGDNIAYRADGSTVLRELNNDWNWGFLAEGSYHFGTGSDISIDWTHYSSITSQAGFVGNIPTGVTITPSILSDYSVSNENRLDQVDLVMGQHVDFGLIKNMRLYGGVQYANIKTHVANYYESTIVANTNVSLFDNSDYKGVGPLVGIDYAYNVISTLSITANGSGSILYGTSRYNAGYVLDPAGLIFASVYASKKTIVPTLQAKLGLNYAYSMANGVMNFAAGYQVMNYFDVLQTQYQQTPTNAVVSANYSLFGPYFGFKYLGNA